MQKKLNQQKWKKNIKIKMPILTEQTQPLKIHEKKIQGFYK